MNRTVAHLRSRNAVWLLGACGRRRALYGDNHLGRQQRGPSALVSQLPRQPREPAARLHSDWKLSVTVEEKTKGDVQAGLSEGENRDAAFFLSVGFSPERLRWLLALQTAARRTVAAAGEADCSRS